MTGGLPVPVASFKELETYGFIKFTSIESARETINYLGKNLGTSLLEPKSAEDSNPWSHSGVNGYGAFPWHTDGAISLNPPRWMMLECLVAETSTSTELLLPDENALSLLRKVVLKMTDQIGRSRFLPAAVPLGKGRFRLRWDPRVGVPGDPGIIDSIESRGASNTMDWQEEAVLVVDNYRILHRRPAVRHDAKRILRRTYFGGTNVGL